MLLLTRHVERRACLKVLRNLETGISVHGEHIVPVHCNDAVISGITD